MSDIDDQLKAWRRKNLIAWVNNGLWFLAGVAVGMLIAVVIG